MTRGILAPLALAFWYASSTQAFATVSRTYGHRLACHLRIAHQNVAAFPAVGLERLSRHFRGRTRTTSTRQMDSVGSARLRRLGLHRQQLSMP
jgi:hypothetical protein